MFIYTLLEQLEFTMGEGYLVQLRAPLPWEPGTGLDIQVFNTAAQSLIGSIGDVIT